jgi:predicted amidophosphoribosyltransferase
MSCEEEQSIEAQQQVLELRLKLRPESKLDTTNPSGLCLYCQEEVGHERRWCVDIIQNNKVIFSCRDSYVKENKLRQSNPGYVYDDDYSGN